VSVLDGGARRRFVCSMSVRQPHAMNAAFADAFNARDLDALVALFEEDAVVVEQDGALRQGSAGVRRHLEELLALPGRMRSENRSAVHVGDMAMLTARWGIRDGDTLVAAATSSELVRRGRDGTWRYVVDQPFACARTMTLAEGRHARRREPRSVPSSR